MKDIAIYGAGGLGKEVVCLIDRINKSQSKPQWRLIGFFDDGKPIGRQRHGCRWGKVQFVVEFKVPDVLPTSYY